MDFSYNRRKAKDREVIFFRSDYSLGAHPAVMKALTDTNMEHTDGYGIDEHCENAERIIKDLIGRQDCHVHMLVGGTPCNVIAIAAALRPYEGVVAVKTGHINTHETGAVEATGHKIFAMDGINGKLTLDGIDAALDDYQDEHTIVPRMVYISQPTECGSLYSKAELQAIYDKCKANDMLLYIDGARLGSALTSSANDASIKDLAGLCDAFYIGGTKNGALFGEALVILNDVMNDHFRYMLKRQCGMLAKGRLLGVQFEALLTGGENSVYYEMADHANKMADVIRDGLEKLGIEFYSESYTNQVFPILPVEVIRALEKDFFFHEWAPERDGMIPVRFVTSWGTTREEVDALVEAIRTLYK